MNLLAHVTEIAHEETEKAVSDVAVVNPLYIFGLAVFIAVIGFFVWKLLNKK